jgi:hypothetical protein
VPLERELDGAQRRPTGVTPTRAALGGRAVSAEVSGTLSQLSLSFIEDEVLSSGTGEALRDRPTKSRHPKSGCKNTIEVYNLVN